MMNTLEEEEESKGTTDEPSPPSSPDVARSRGPSVVRENEVPDRRQDNDRSERRYDREIPHINEIHATPRPARRLSTFEAVLHALRRPSTATFDYLRRGSASRRGSHANIDLGRRPSPASADLLNHSPRSSETSVQIMNRQAAIPPNHVSFRRPSGIVTFNPDMMNNHQKRYIMGLLQVNNNSSSSSLPEICKETKPRKKEKPKVYKGGNDALISVLSVFYGKFLLVLGIAFPVTQVVSEKVETNYYQGFYLYLYLGSLAFMTFMYMTFLKDRAITQLLKSSFDEEDDDFQRIQSRREKKNPAHIERYGSFYLRLGAVAFGIGSMVYSGLEFGEYFEVKEEEGCHSLVQALTPVARMILTLAQMQFIFLTSKHMELSRCRGIARFGLMHVIATNLCEWLYVIVEETKHEIIHIRHGEHGDTEEKHKRDAEVHDIYQCRRGDVIGSLVQDASPFLFPCTIEYSLICAVIMYEMWKTVSNASDTEDGERRVSISRQSSTSTTLEKSNNHFSVDCSNAHKGLFSGILILVVTIISLIMFFVMTKDPRYISIAQKEVYIWELMLYILTTIVVFCGCWKMRFLKFKAKKEGEGLGLDESLLVWAQSGVYIHCMFSIIACYFMISISSPAGVMTEVINLIQSTVQTVFILDAACRRTDTHEQHRSKPGRQIVTFLLVSNMALWLINVMQRSRAEFRPTHMEFFGEWAWTVITHVSMPLAIFFRFHSTICLFEIWKKTYKLKASHEPQHVQLIGHALH